MIRELWEIKLLFQEIIKILIGGGVGELLLLIKIWLLSKIKRVMGLA